MKLLQRGQRLLRGADCERTAKDRRRQDISHATAHAAAKAEPELVQIRKARAEAWSLVAESVEGGLVGSIADAINKAESTERYEKRAISRKKKIVRRMLVTE